MTSITPQALATRLDANAAATEALMARLLADAPLENEIQRPATVRLKLTRALARAAGIGGMAGGQMLDLAGEGRFGDKTPPDVAILQQMKTGALLWFGCIAGALMGESADGYKALDSYG